MNRTDISQRLASGIMNVIRLTNNLKGRDTLLNSQQSKHGKTLIYLFLELVCDVLIITGSKSSFLHSVETMYSHCNPAKCSILR